MPQTNSKLNTMTKPQPQPPTDKCQFCNEIGKKVTKYYYGHRNGTYVGLYTERVYRCQKHINNL